MGRPGGRNCRYAPLAFAWVDGDSPTGKPVSKPSGAPFRTLKEVLDSLNRTGYAMDTLSMGMTDDMEAAIAEGSTMVRIGTAIFGARD